MQHNTPHIAVYVAGDGNIFFPALVALTSIKKNNPHIPFEYFMLFDENDLSPQMRQLLDSHGIEFVNTAKLQQYGSLDEFDLMSERAWPREVFYNWLVPYYLKDRGYTHAVKVDYDLLCVAPYELADVFLQDETFAGNTWLHDMHKDGVEVGTLNTLGLSRLNQQPKIPYFNLGFVPINLDLYAGCEVFDSFKQVYIAIQRQEAPVKVAEQAAVALLCVQAEHKIRHLSKDYNMRVTVLPDLRTDLTPEIRNLHFLTSNKPWKPLTFKYIANYASDRRAGLYLFRNIWLNQASQVSGFKEFVSERPLTDIQYAGVFSRVLREIYNRHNAVARG